MSQSSTHMLCSTFVSAKIRHVNLKTSVFNFCGSMLPGFADFNAKNNKKNLHDCNEYMNYDELRNTLKFSTHHSSCIRCSRATISVCK